jgi:hypothetical protein
MMLLKHSLIKKTFYFNKLVTPSYYIAIHYTVERLSYIGWVFADFSHFPKTEVVLANLVHHYWSVLLPIFENRGLFVECSLHHISFHFLGD